MNRQLLILLFGFFASVISFASTGEIGHALFINAQKTLQQVQLNEKASRELMLEANNYRKELKSLHADQSSSREGLQQKISELGKKMQESQQQGQSLRAKANDQLIEAKQSFYFAMANRWKSIVSTDQPLNLGNSSTMFSSHNANIRSVHPNMPEPINASMEIKDGMSIPVPVKMGQNVPQDLDLSVLQLSRSKRYIAHIKVATKEHIPLNEIHSWHLFVTDLNGNPIEGSPISLTGHMPGHVHGLPTEPRVTAEISPGLYKVDGLKFQMAGWWVMTFNIPDSGEQQDSVTFNLVL